MPAPRLRTTVLGAGSWGTALAALASSQSDTLLWARDTAQAHAIDTRHVNARYLPDTRLPEALRCTDDFEQAVAHACPAGQPPGLIILGVPVAGMAETCLRLSQALARQPGSPPPVVWTCKGFDHANAQLPHEIAESAL